MPFYFINLLPTSLLYISILLLQALIRDHLILPYLFGDFHPSHIQEYAGGLLIALEKPANPDGSPGCNVTEFITRHVD